MSKITDLKFDNKNFNKGTEYGKSLMQKSLEKFGAGRSILIDKNNKIIAGNKTTENFGELGLEDVKIIEADGKTLIAVKRNDIDLDTPEGREFALADNQTAKVNIDFDFGELESELESSVIEEWGLEIPEDEFLEAEEDDFDEAPPEEPITLLGDLYEIGEHRLLCGDSTDSEHVAKLMNGEKADMVFTDPPYEVDFDYANTLMFSKDCHVFIFNNDRALIRQLSESPLEFKKFFVFNHSGCAIPQEGGNECFLDHILISHEVNGSPDIRYNKGNGTRTVIKGEYRRAEEHKHEKPIKVIEPIILGYSDKKDIVLDFFLGGGSTMSTSHQLKRKCYGLELDPKYCDVIVKRMLKLDPSLTIKRNGEVIDVKEFTIE